MAASLASQHPAVFPNGDAGLSGLVRAAGIPNGDVGRRDDQGRIRGLRLAAADLLDGFFGLTIAARKRQGANYQWEEQPSFHLVFASRSTGLANAGKSVWQFPGATNEQPSPSKASRANAIRFNYRGVFNSGLACQPPIPRHVSLRDGDVVDACPGLSSVAAIPAWHGRSLPADRRSCSIPRPDKRRMRSYRSSHAHTG